MTVSFFFGCMVESSHLLGGYELVFFVVGAEVVGPLNNF